MLIIFSGLPGVGKSTLAKDVAKQIGATYVRVDSIERGMAESVLKIHPAEDAGYTVGYSVAEDNLRNGQCVVADSVNPIDRTRDDWRAVAQAAGCDAIEVEVICSDLDEHRRRIERRIIEHPDLRLPTWHDVLGRDYRPWQRDSLIVDTALKNVPEAVDDVMKEFERRRSGRSSII